MFKRNRNNILMLSAMVFWMSLNTTAIFSAPGVIPTSKELTIKKAALKNLETKRVPKLEVIRKAPRIESIKRIQPERMAREGSRKIRPSIEAIKKIPVERAPRLEIIGKSSRIDSIKRMPSVKVISEKGSRNIAPVESIKRMPSVEVISERGSRIIHPVENVKIRPPVKIIGEAQSRIIRPVKKIQTHPPEKIIGLIPSQDIIPVEQPRLRPPGYIVGEMESKIIKKDPLKDLIGLVNINNLDRARGFEVEESNDYVQASLTRDLEAPIVQEALPKDLIKNIPLAEVSIKTCKARKHRRFFIR